MNGSMRSHYNGVPIDFVQHLPKVSEIRRIAVGHKGEALKIMLPSFKEAS
jgi:hypothetical protein